MPPVHKRLHIHLDTTKTRLRMRLWTSVSEAALRMKFTQATRP